MPASHCGIEQLGPASNGWAPVQAMLNGHLWSGYVEEALLAPGQQYSTYPFMSDLVSPQLCVVSITSPDVLNVRIGPSVDAALLDTLAPNECRIFTSGQTDPTGRWLQVSVDQTSLGGWVAAAFVESTMLAYVPRGDAPNQAVLFETIQSLNTGEPILTGGGTQTMRLTLPGGPIAGTEWAERSWLVASIDINGTPPIEIELPAEIDPTQLVVSVYWPQDRFCLSNGTPERVADGRYRVPVLTLCV